MTSHRVLQAALGALAVCILAAPIAQAAGQTGFTDQLYDPLHPTDRAYVLLPDAPSRGHAVTLLPHVPFQWVERTPLELAAPLSGDQVHFSLAFQNASGDVTVAFGSWTPPSLPAVPGGSLVPTGIFTAAGPAQTIRLVPTPRQLLGDTDLPKGATDVGLATGTLVLSGNAPAGSHLAFQLTTSAANQLLPAPETALSSATPSTATIPLPELPAPILLGMGLLLVGLVARRVQRS